MAATISTTFVPYPNEVGDRTETVSLTLTEPDATLREFRFASTQGQRDKGPQQRTVMEIASDPQLRSGSAMLDGLFALALLDARLNSVSEIRDGAYNNGQPIPCECFQTGEFWTYVWTRDVSYASHLGLAWLDPQRVAHSLLFKTSGWRSGTRVPHELDTDWTQIVQDTGSGGSWPVSTDRVTWAWGAEAALATLAPVQRATFAAKAYAALRGTIEADRLAAFDAATGLYGGEQSFLDWRTQTYAPWIVNNLSHMASSKALSTNVSHWQALTLAARLATERGQGDVAQRYQGWANALSNAINHVFWLDDVKRYASVTTDDLQPRALHQFDMLGTALVVLSGIAPPERARQALAHYPHAPFGVPVIDPQQPNVYVYHNRAIWPFVSAYALRAAAATRNAAVASHALISVMRAASLNLSNMENLEWLTAKPQYDDGPAINSRRQLWSVGGFLSAVAHSVFGFQPQWDSLRIDPFLTVTMRRILGDTDQAVLRRLKYQGRDISVALHLPSTLADASLEGWYPTAQVLLNGQPVVDGLIRPQMLHAGDNSIEVRFGPLRHDARAITRIASGVDSLSHTDARVFAPPTPLTPVWHKDAQTGHVTLQFDTVDSGLASLERVIYRDGRQVGTMRVADPKATQWQDPVSHEDGLWRCYSVQWRDPFSGHHSQPSEPLCLGDEHSIAWPLKDVESGVEWVVQKPGRYRLDLAYNNHANDISTGVTNAVKRLRVFDLGDTTKAEGMVQMPHVQPRDGQHPLRHSTAVIVMVDTGRYRLTLSDFFNMSDLQANASYRGAGGAAGAMNHADVVAVRVFQID